MICISIGIIVSCRKVYLRHRTIENIYRPQRSWAKVIFSQACVCPQGGEGCLPQCMLGSPRSRPPPPGSRPPLEQRPPPGADTPPQEQTPPPGADSPPGPGTPPPREADCSIRLTNAFLLHFVFTSYYIVQINLSAS